MAAQQWADASFSVVCWVVGLVTIEERDFAAHAWSKSYPPALSSAVLLVVLVPVAVVW